MRQKYLISVASLTIASITGACSGDDSSKEKASSSEEAGTGGDRGSTSNGGRVAAAGGSAAAGRSSLDAGVTSSAGSAGRNVSPNGAAGAGGSIAGRAAAGAGGIAGGGGARAPQGGTAAQAGTGGAQAIRLTDAQVASVLQTANAGEVQQNMVALSKATAPEARIFAQDLINMHQAAQLRLNTLLTTLNITPQVSPVGDRLLKASDRILAKLQGEPGVTFDMTYLQSQIDVHIQVLDLIDRTLLPNARNEQLRTEITLIRGEVATHLQRARGLAASLNLDVDAGVGGEIDAG